MTTRRVLIVDDEPYILRILAFKFRRAGYDAVEAPDLIEALAALERSPVHCIVLDVSLGYDQDGFEFAGRLRDDVRFCRTPVVFLTAHSLPADIRRGEQLGAASYITKPFSLDRVLAEVDRITLAEGEGPAAR